MNPALVEEGHTRCFFGKVLVTIRPTNVCKLVLRQCKSATAQAYERVRDILLGTPWVNPVQSAEVRPLKAEITPGGGNEGALVANLCPEKTDSIYDVVLTECNETGKC